MHNLKFLEATLIHGVKGVTVKAPGLQRVLDAYTANVQNAVGITTLPGFACWTAYEWATVGTVAKDKIVGRDATDAQIARAANQIGPLAEKMMFEKMQVSRDEQLRNLKESTVMFEYFSMRAGPFAQEVLLSILKQVVIQMWSAFEVLSEDLLTAAFYNNPACFPNPGKKHFRFRSRTAIRESYTATFKVDITRIMGVLNKDCIDVLSLLRNVLVHKTGIADAEFVRDIKPIPMAAAFHHLNDGDSIEWDGTSVHLVSDAVTKCGCDLLRAVDRWIKDHTP